MNDASASCLCGAVRFTVKLAEDHFHVCHCSICRRQSSGPQMAVMAAEPPVFSGDGTLTWYKSSEWAERGFCSICGTNMLWRMTDGSMTIVSLGALEKPEDLHLGSHIYVDSKPDYYDFKDDCPRLTEAEVMAAIANAE